MTGPQTKPRFPTARLPMDRPRSQTWPTTEQKRKTLDLLGVSLYESQQLASMFLAGRRRVPQALQVIGGERSGKSQWVAHEATSLLPWCDLVYIAGASYENTEPEFEYIANNLRTLGDLADCHMPQNGQWSLATSFGCRVETISLKNGSDALITTGKAPDLVILAEAGLVNEDEFLAAFTRVSEKRGAVILVGTLKRAKPWYVALYRQLQGDNPYAGVAYTFPAWQNRSVYPGGRHDPAILALEEALGPTRFAERIGAEPVPSPLLVFGQEFDYHLHAAKHIAYDPDLPLLLACDPGYAGAYALLVVQAASASDVRVIDEYYQQYATWDKAVAWLRARPYIQQDGGQIGNVSRAVMDIAGRQHHADKSQIEQWQAETGIYWRANPVGIELGISRLRDFLRSPFAWDVSRIRIDPSCEGLIWELQEGEQYPRDREGNAVKEAPIDANNHSRKALSYLLVDAFGRNDGDAAVNQPGVNRLAPMLQDQPAVTLLHQAGGGVRFGLDVPRTGEPQRERLLRFR